MAIEFFQLREELFHFSASFESFCHLSSPPPYAIAAADDEDEEQEAKETTQGANAGDVGKDEKEVSAGEGDHPRGRTGVMEVVGRNRNTLEEAAGSKRKKKEAQVVEADEPNWDRWLKLEAAGKKKSEMKEPRKKKKTKAKCVNRALAPGEEGEDAKYLFPEYMLDDQQPEEPTDHHKECDEFEEIMRDFPYDSMWRDFPREWSKKIVVDDCQHDFIFRDDIGKVCVDCGKVAQLVTHTYDFPIPVRRARTIKGQKLEDDDADSRAPQKQQGSNREELDAMEELTPLELHAKLMHEHQKEGFRFVFRNLFGRSCGGISGGAFLHHAPGTGKTFLVISFLQSYFFRFPGRRALISAPKNMLEPWQREIQKWEIDSIAVTLLAADNASGKLSLVSSWYETGTGILLVTPQLLAHSIDGAGGTSDDGVLIRSMLIDGPDVLVVDEAHYARTETTKIFNTLSKILTRQRIFLSGTAFQNSFKELFNLLNLCRSNFLDGSPAFEAFAEVHSTRNMKRFFKEEVLCRMAYDREGAVRTFRSLTEPFVQWYGGKVLDKLPGLEEFVVVLRLSESHLEKVKKCVDWIRNPVAGDNKLSRACVHPCLSEATFLYHNQSPWQGSKTGFIFELLDYVKDKERVIVFSQYRAPLTLLKQMLKEHRSWSEAEEILYIDGGTSVDERVNITDEFNDEKSKARILLASLKTCGEGISLVGGSRVVILDIAWNPAVVRQAISRAFRIGQKKKVFVYRLLASKTEETEKLKSSLEKEVQGRAVFDKEFELGSVKATMIPAEDCTRRDVFLEEFLGKDDERCEGIYISS